VGTSGQVVLETRNMVHIRTDSGIKKIVKEAVKKFYLKNEFGGCFISGSSLIGRPEERVSRTN
jgi:RNase P/RNase MRP subunit p29